MLTKTWLLFILLLLVLITGFFLLEIREENRRLKAAMRVVETSLEEERELLQGQVDSLQSVVLRQEEQNNTLKLELSQLEGQHQHLNSRYHEKQTAILRISDADSLYREIARHYGN